MTGPATVTQMKQSDSQRHVNANSKTAEKKSSAPGARQKLGPETIPTDPENVLKDMQPRVSTAAKEVGGMIQRSLNQDIADKDGNQRYASPDYDQLYFSDTDLYLHSVAKRK